MGAINALLFIQLDEEVPPHFPVSYMLYVSLVDLVSSNKVCCLAEVSVYKLMFVMYAEIVHVQCYRGWYVETGYIITIFEKL